VQEHDWATVASKVHAGRGGKKTMNFRKREREKEAPEGIKKRAESTRKKKKFTKSSI